MEDRKEQDVPPSTDSTAAPSVQVISDPEKGTHMPAQQDSDLNPANPDDKAGNGYLSTEKQDESATPATPEPGPPPDGGAKAWSTVLGAFCGLFVSFGWINCECTRFRCAGRQC